MKTILVVLTFFFASTPLEAQKSNSQKGNVIFLHPDGTSVAAWNAVRIFFNGPDSSINWDKLSNIGIYLGHLTNSLSATSNGGATVHAYGIKVSTKAYGQDNGAALTARSGKKMSIMKEAMSAGIKTGIINSGSITEPGTGVFVASESNRSNGESISEQIINSGTDIILCGGEDWLLPKDSKGFHSINGRRTDGKNLIEKAKELGYTIVYTRDQLISAVPSSNKILGVFAAEHTFNDKTEEELEKNATPLFSPTAPSLAEMTKAAIEILSRNNSQFFLVIEEEGTDNFAGKNNAIGMFTSLKRADDALGFILEFMKKNKNTLAITCSDSEAGGMELIGFTEEQLNPNEPIPLTAPNGSIYDGIKGNRSLPFVSAPDKYGNRLPFVVSWSTTDDASGSVVVRASGLNADMVKGSIDNTGIYKIMYKTLFGKTLK